MKTIHITKIALAALLGGAALLPAAAQAQDPHPHRPGINQRLHNQNARIERGEAGGELTNREAGRLERRDNRIHRQEARDRRSHDGRLTAGERRRLNGDLNRTSGAIYRHNHDIGTR